MGGEGSGRKPSVETIIKQSQPELNPIGDGLFLPNYSGVQSAALKTEAPLSSGGAGDNLGNHTATQIISGSQITLTNATTGNAIKIFQTASTGTGLTGAGALNIINDDNIDDALVVTSDQASPSSGANLVRIQTTNASWNRPLLRIIDNSTSGGAPNLRIDSNNPDIEIVESDQVSPNGKFEIAAQGNRMQINSRNAADNSFEQITNWRQKKDGGMMSHYGSISVSGSYTIEGQTLLSGSVALANMVLTTNQIEVPNLVRWIKPYHWAPAATSQSFTAGRVLLSEFEVLNNCIADAINYTSGTTVSGSQVIVGIYGAIPTEETCSGSPLLVQQSHTQSGANTAQLVSISGSRLNKGRYYLAIQGQDLSGSYLRNSNSTQVLGWGQQFNSTYGSLTDPCPATTDTGSAIHNGVVRCSS